MFNVKKSNTFHFLSILFRLGGSFVASLMFIIWQQFGGEPSGLFNLAFSQLVLVFGPVLIYFIIHRGSLSGSLYLKNPGLVNLLLSALLVFCLLPTVSLLNMLSMFFVKNQIADTIISLTDVPYLLAVVCIALFPGIFEELSTRFILLDNYRYKPYYVACIVSGFFFGMLHLNINQFIYAFVLGVIFSFVVQITGSIFPSILMHTLLNATTFSLSYFASKYISADTLAETVGTTPNFTDVIALLGVNVITLPLVFLLLGFLIKYNGKKSILKQKPTVMELTLGQKISEQQIPAYPFSSPYVDAPAAAFVQAMPTSSTASAKNAESSSPLPKPIPADPTSPFNWAFWASVILFLAFTFLNEFAAG